MLGVLGIGMSWNRSNRESQAAQRYLGSLRLFTAIHSFEEVSYL